MTGSNEGGLLTLKLSHHKENNGVSSAPGIVYFRRRFQTVLDTVFCVRALVNLVGSRKFKPVVTPMKRLEQRGLPFDELASSVRVGSLAAVTES
ncbi:hypothetical protein MRX96_030730 [Rhipicephalus microplus]